MVPPSGIVSLRLAHPMNLARSVKCRACRIAGTLGPTAGNTGWGTQHSPAAADLFENSSRKAAAATESQHLRSHPSLQRSGSTRILSAWAMRSPRRPRPRRSPRRDQSRSSPSSAYRGRPPSQRASGPKAAARQEPSKPALMTCNTSRRACLVASSPSIGQQRAQPLTAYQTGR